MASRPREIKIPVPEFDTEVSGLVIRPRGAIALLVIGHGAGAGMTHPVLENLALQLEELAIATLRYNFPYKEHGGRRPDRTRVLTATARAAVAAGSRACRSLPLFAGGKSMGGRMTSQAMAEEPIEDVQGLVFFGFPLHAPGKPGIARADHLAEVTSPMLFIQGTRDRLADIALMRGVVADLGTFGQMHVIDDADHSFNLPKRSGRTQADAIRELAEVTCLWIANIVAPAPAESGMDDAPL